MATRQQADSGADSLRRSIASRQRLPKARLVRFVIGPDSAVVPDLAECLPGRGLWLEASRDMVDTACARNLFAKAARSRAEIDAELANTVERLLARRCLDLIGLARRAAQAVAGFEKSCAVLRRGAAAVLVSAAESSPASRAKLRALASGLPCVTLFSAAELGAVFGRESVVHVVLTAGRLARSFLGEADRLAGFRSAACAQRVE